MTVAVESDQKKVIIVPLNHFRQFKDCDLCGQMCKSKNPANMFMSTQLAHDVGYEQIKASITNVGSATFIKSNMASSGWL